MEMTTYIDLIRAITEKLQTFYVFPNIAEKICICLQNHLAEGDYTGITEGKFLAYALTSHLQEVNQDEHLWVKWHAEPLPAEAETLRRNQIWRDERRLEAKFSNYGFHRVERLSGNVGYLDIRYFHPPSWGGDTAVAAMNFLANMHALIIDIRQCQGGYPGMVSLISSYLLREEPVHLNSIYWRDEEVTQQYWTLPYIPGHRFRDKPVYVLISKATFSAGEGFAYDMQVRRRAKIIGGKTDGGAHPGASYQIHPHFELFIPIGRPIHPITGQNWEGVGVTPDVSVAVELALEVAHKMALESIIETIGRTPSGPIRRLLAEARAAHTNYKPHDQDN